MDYKSATSQVGTLLAQLSTETEKSSKGVAAAQVRYRKSLSDIINLCKKLRTESLASGTDSENQAESSSRSNSENKAD